MEIPVNYQGYIARAIEDGHKAGEVLGNDLVQNLIRDMANEFYLAFLHATDDETRRMAHAKANVLEEIYVRLVAALEVGTTTAGRLKATEE